MASNYDNSESIMAFISSKAIEDYKPVPYVPQGCFADEKRTIRLPQNELRRDIKILIKNEKNEDNKKKLRLIQTTEALCKQMNYKFLPIGSSGVTFSFGIDLGQVDEKTLKVYGISDKAINAVRPYLMVKKSTELNNILGKQQIVIPADILKEFEEKYMKYFITQTASIFDNLSAPAATLKFAELTKNNQSVLFSIIWHNGVNSLKKHTWIKDVFTFGGKNEWAKAKDVLQKQSTGQYANRRKAEANKIDI